MQHMQLQICVVAKTSCTQHLVACDNTYATCIYGVNIHVHSYIPIQM